MEQNSPKPRATTRTCPHCGNDVPAGDKRCWLCLHSLDPSEPADQVVLQPAAQAKPAGGSAGLSPRARVAAAAQAAAPDQSHGFSLATLMMFITLACVILGLATIAPGLAVPLGIVMLVAWTQTTWAARVRVQRGETVTQLDKVAMFLSSFAFMVIILVLVGVAGIAAFFAICATILGAFDVSQSGNDAESLVIGSVAVGCAAVAAIVFLIIYRVTRKLLK